MKKLAIIFMACSLIIGVSCKQSKESKKEEIKKINKKSTYGARVFNKTY